MFSQAQICDNEDINKSSKLMGIGLAFCHKCLNVMGSKLELTTALKIGSTFSFTLKGTSQQTHDYVEDVCRVASTPHGSGSFRFDQFEQKPKAESKNSALLPTKRISRDKSAVIARSKMNLLVNLSKKSSADKRTNELEKLNIGINIISLKVTYRV